jgi:molybdopterin converting factor small subunit
MRVTVNIYAYLRYYLPPDEKSVQDKEWEMPEGSTVSQVLERLKLPREVRVTVLVNSNSVDINACLKEGDIVHILPQMVGG